MLTTLEITDMYYLAALSGTSLGLLIILVTVMELSMAKLRMELKLFTKSKKHWSQKSGIETNSFSFPLSFVRQPNHHIYSAVYMCFLKNISPEK